MRHGFGEFIENNGVGAMSPSIASFKISFRSCCRQLFAGSIIGTFLNGLPSGSAVRIMASGAKYSGGFVHGLYCGRGSALFFDGSSYVGEWDSGLRQRSGRWMHSDSDHQAPEVLGKVFEAVKRVMLERAGAEMAPEHRDAHALPAPGCSDLGDNGDDATATAADFKPSSVSSTASSHHPLPLPPDSFFVSAPGKMGGEGALDAGRAGNPSGLSRITITHSPCNCFACIIKHLHATCIITRSNVLFFP
jgi:hypothetical protein